MNGVEQSNRLLLQKVFVLNYAKQVQSHGAIMTDVAAATISKPLHRILSELTGAERFDIALHLATKDLVRLRLKEAEENLKMFAGRYGMSFEQFQRAWEDDQIANKHSYEIEKDFWEWEAAHTDSVKLNEMLDRLP